MNEHVTLVYLVALLFAFVYAFHVRARVRREFAEGAPEPAGCVTPLVHPAGPAALSMKEGNDAQTSTRPAGRRHRHVDSRRGRIRGDGRTPLGDRPLFEPHLDPRGTRFGPGLDALDEDTQLVVRAFLGEGRDF